MAEGIHRHVLAEKTLQDGSKEVHAGADEIFLILALRAKCRQCAAPISWQYPLVEAVTGVLFLLVFLRFGFVVATPIYMIVAAALVLVTATDIRCWIIPNEVTLPGIPIAMALAAVVLFYPESGLRVMGPSNALLNAFIGIEAGGGLIFIMDKAARLILKKRGMGGGDVKLLAMLGGLFGWPGVILVVLIASVLGSILGIILVSLARKEEHGGNSGKEEPVTFGDFYGFPGTILLSSIVGAIMMFTKKEELPEENVDEEEVSLSAHYLPFGPYLCLAGLVVMFYGAEIVKAYIHYAGMNY